MKVIGKVWKFFSGAGIIFSSRPAGSYSQYLTDTCSYHH